MARLPTPGADAGEWGDLLNDFLRQIHQEDGQLKANVVSAVQLRNGSVTNPALGDGTISENKLDQSVKDKLNALASVTDGRDVELQADSSHIQWRYVDDITWTNLIALDDLKGTQGERGEKGDKGDAGNPGAKGDKGDPGTTDYSGLTNKPDLSSLHTHSNKSTLDATTASFTTAKDTKLTEIAAGATANATDAQLRDRSTHTGTQAISTVADLQNTLDAKLSQSSTASTVYVVGAGGGQANIPYAANADALSIARRNETGQLSAASPTTSSHVATKAYVDSGVNDKSTTSYVISRGENLVTNGTGYLGTNYNFSWSTLNKPLAPEGVAGVFHHLTGAGATRLTDEAIPIRLGASYNFSYQIRETVAGKTSRFFSLLRPVDAYGNLINPDHYMFHPNTTTTLAQELKPGDTTIKITDPTNWYGTSGRPANATTHFRKIILWDYIDPGGKAWPEFTYSKNTSTFDTWADGGIAADGIITLRAPWPSYLGTHPAGVSVSNGSSGSTSMYRENNLGISASEGWKTYSGNLTLAPPPPATAASGRAVPASIPAGWMPPGTAQVYVGWILSYQGSDAGSQQAIASVLFSEAGAAIPYTDSRILRGTGSPEGVMTAVGGTIYVDTVATGGVAAWVKKSGTGPTGWGPLDIRTSAPASSTSPGVAGQIAYGSGYIYVCTATNTWMRAALTSW